MANPTRRLAIVLVCTGLAVTAALTACRATDEKPAAPASHAGADRSAPADGQAAQTQGQVSADTKAPSRPTPAAIPPVQPCLARGAQGRPTKSLKRRGLVLEYEWSSRGPDPDDRFGFRVGSNGSLEILSSGQTDFVDGQLVTKKIPLAWRTSGRLTAAEQKRLADAIRTSGLFDLPGEVNRAGKVQDGAGFSLAVSLDGKEVEVGGDDGNHPVISGLTELLTELSAAVDERAHKGR